MVLLLTSGSFAATSVALAADDVSVEQLKSELQKTQQENERLRLQLQNNNLSPDVTSDAAVPTPAPATGSVVAATTSEEALGKVVVRGRNNRLATLNDVPQSIAVVSGDELKRLGADSMRDVIKRVANIQRQDRSNARSSDLSIRGIGRKGNSEAQDPNVGVIVDGVSYGYSGLSAWDFADVDSVEVLRGPQGTLGAKNSSIGSVSINTKRPSFTNSTDVSLRFGERNTFIGNAATGGPVIDDLLAWRGTFYVDKMEGYWQNSYDNGDSTYTDRNKISGKVQLLLTPSETFSALLSVDLQPRTAENDNGLNFFHEPVPTYSDGVPVSTANFTSTRLARRWFGQQTSYSYNNNYLNYLTGTQNQNDQRALLTGIWGGSLNLEWTPGEYSVKSITGYRKLYFDARNDEGTPFDVSAQGGGGMRYTQFSQEVRLTSPLGRTVEYQAGLYFIRNRNEVDSKTGWGSDAGAWFIGGTNTSGAYKGLDADGNGRYLLENSLSGLRKIGTAITENSSPAVYANLNWHITEPLSLGTGARVTRETRNASNFAAIGDNGFGAELNDGLFNNRTDGTLTDGTGSDLTTNTPQQIAAANAVALKYFGTANYLALTIAQKQQLADAKALRKSQLGLLYPLVNATPIHKTQLTYNLTPSYEFNKNITGYVAYQHGEKAPVAQVINGASANALPEETNNVELGLKSNLLDKTLTINADVFFSKIKNYQQAVSVVDNYQLALNAQLADPTIPYVSLTGNVPRAQVKGLEIDGLYNGIKQLTIRFAGAYNDARYVEFKNSPLKAETDTKTPDPTNATGFLKYQDLSGSTLPGASKFSGSIGVDYRLPVTARTEINFDLNTSYLSRYNTDVSLSDYAWIGGFAVTDVGVGIGAADQSWNVTLLGKNIFNKIAISYGFTSGTLETTPRWLGVQFSAKL